MPKQRINLTQRFVDSVKPPPKDSEVYADSHTRGLSLRMRSSGAKTWVVRYRWQGAEHMATHPVDVLPLTEARRWAHSIKADVARGNPPHLAKIVERKRHPKTVEELGNEVLDHLRGQSRSEKYLGECERYHRTYIVPAIGHIEAAKLTRLDVDRILRPLVSKPSTHNRVLSWVTKMLNQGRQWDVLGFDWHSHLDRQTERTRDYFLTDVQLDRLTKELGETATDRCIAFLMLTGARPGEAFKARWDQFDLDAGDWRKPVANTKSRKGHAVPLAPDIVAVLRTMKAEAEKQAADNPDAPNPGTEWVFPSPRPGARQHLTTVKNRWATLCRLAKLGDANPYDLRHTFATRLLSQGNSIKTVQSLTGHATPTVLLKHYAHVIAEDQRKAVQGLMRPARGAAAAGVSAGEA